MGRLIAVLEQDLSQSMKRALVVLNKLESEIQCCEKDSALSTAE